MSTTTITEVAARRVYDSRGRPTVEVEVTTQRGLIVRAIAPAGASRGSGEAVDRRDGGARFGGLDVMGAVKSGNGEVRSALVGLDASDQGMVDEVLTDLDGTVDCSRLGGNVMVATSMAVAWAGADGEPLWRHLAADLLAGRGPVDLPLPEVQVIGGGAHAHRSLDLQDLMVVPLGASTLAEALEWTAEVYLAAGMILDERGTLVGVADEGGWFPAFDSNEDALSTVTAAIERAGFAPGDQVAISVDVAASELVRDGRYCLDLEGRTLDADGWQALLVDLVDRYPICSIEDPVAEDDLTGAGAFTTRAGPDVQVVGDDLLVTSAQRVLAAADAGACTALLLKPNQSGTVSTAKQALVAARSSGLGAIASARSGETEDVTIVHLAVGWQVPQIKVGSISRGERTAKWNELLRIEEALGPRANLARFHPDRRVPPEALSTSTPTVQRGRHPLHLEEP